MNGSLRQTERESAPETGKGTVLIFTINWFQCSIEGSVAWSVLRLESYVGKPD